MKREWTDLEFADWTLLRSEAALLANKTGPTRLGFAVLLKFQYAARFPLSMQEVPTTAVGYIAGQVGVPAEELGVWGAAEHNAELGIMFQIQSPIKS
jgi:hypothetical protein